MSRFIPPHPKKWSPEAYAWAAKMQAARKKKRKRNPGEAWHKDMEQAARSYGHRSTEPLEKVLMKGVEIAHRDSAGAARALKMNPAHGEWFISKGTAKQPKILERWIKSRDGKDGKQIIQREARAWRFLQGFRYGTQWSFESIGVFPELSMAYASAKYTQKHLNPSTRRVKRNPIAIYGNPRTPKKVCSTVAGVIYKHAVEIRATKTTRHKGDYKHPYGPGVQILGLDNGDVVLHHKRGKKLWISRTDYERHS